MPPKKIEATFDCPTWEEKDIPPLKGDETKLSMRITRTRAERTFKGGLIGKGVAEYTFVYHYTGGPASEAKANCESSQEVTFNGLMYFKGMIEGIEGEGEVVFECVNGSWGKEGVMKVICEWKAIPGTGVGAFTDLKANGGYESTGKISTCWVELE